MDDDQKPRGRGRPRKEERATRRRKRSGGPTIGKRLGVDMTELDQVNYTYRWINDTPARVMAMTKRDDWDVVTQDGGIVKEDATDLGAAVSLVVGRAPDGSALLAYLCRKPRHFWIEDQAEKNAVLDGELDHVRRGLDPKTGDPLSDYVVPDGGIRVAR